MLALLVPSTLRQWRLTAEAALLRHRRATCVRQVDSFGQGRITVGRPRIFGDRRRMVVLRCSERLRVRPTAKLSRAHPPPQARQDCLTDTTVSGVTLLKRKGGRRLQRGLGGPSNYEAALAGAVDAARGWESDLRRSGQSVTWR
jgi:hypothetical protein